jgi:catechol 2,3-dioxygenase-like lactoylglutathione lyase family enzyme
MTMAVIGTHALLYTSEPEALRACLRDAFGWPNVDAHDGWLIFALPPAELGIHPADAPAHQLSFMCDDIRATIADLSSKGVVFEGEPEDRGFGVGVNMVLPGGVDVLLYEPKHATAI